MGISVLLALSFCDLLTPLPVVYSGVMKEKVDYLEVPNKLTDAP